MFYLPIIVLDKCLQAKPNPNHKALELKGKMTDIEIRNPDSCRSFYFSLSLSTYERKASKHVLMEKSLAIHGYFMHPRSNEAVNQRIRSRHRLPMFGKARARRLSMGSISPSVPK